jgi:hypothetical protein
MIVAQESSLQKSEDPISNDVNNPLVDSTPNLNGDTE